MENIIDILENEIINNKFENEKLDFIVNQFRKKGFLLLKDIFSKTLINNLNNQFFDKYSAYFDGKSNYYSSKLSNGRYNITIDIRDAFNNDIIYANPLIISILKKVFIDQMIIGDIACVTSMPGAVEQEIHRDGTIYDGNPLVALLPPPAIGLLIPLIPFNELNGTTRFWPNSHINNSTIGDFNLDTNYFDGEMDIGSCILMDNRLAHRGNENKSKQIRPLLYVNYTAHWYFDQNIYKKQTPICIDDENFNKVPEEHKGLFIRRNIFK